MLEVPSVVTDREWADQWADQLEDLLLEVGQVFPGLIRAVVRPDACGVCWGRCHARTAGGWPSTPVMPAQGGATLPDADQEEPDERVGPHRGHQGHRDQVGAPELLPSCSTPAAVSNAEGRDRAGDRRGGGSDPNAWHTVRWLTRYRRVIRTDTCGSNRRSRRIKLH